MAPGLPFSGLSEWSFGCHFDGCPNGHFDGHFDGHFADHLIVVVVAIAMVILVAIVGRTAWDRYE